MTTREPLLDTQGEFSTGSLSGPAPDSDLTVNGRIISRQRILGAYYTPDRVAEILVRWALNEATGRLLDPSFGGCAFMEAGARVLEELGSRRAGAQVFGIDVDPSCIEYVRNSARLREQNFASDDFLALSPETLPGAPFKAVVGNPPYVRHHWVKDDKRAVARRIADESSVELPETASLWAYFVVHALAFLSRGGRLAVLVPEAILQADYASAVRSVLEANFRRVRLIHLRERLFNGTDEPVVVIAGEDFGGLGAIEVHSVDTAAELSGLLNGLAVARPHTTLESGRRILPEALKAMDQALSTGATSRFDSLATARIGIVTGANSHFIRTAGELRDLGVPAKARSGIVSRTKWLSGLDFLPRNHKTVADAGSRAFLVRPTPSQESDPGVARWIEEGEAAGVHKHFKCQKRNPWYRVPLPPRPEAFVTSTRLGPPLLVLNKTKFRCTNALYAVRFDLPEGVEPECVVLGFLTTFVALWSELNGRRYGGGVLKLDLGTLAELPLPIVPDASSAFADANEALRSGDEKLARQIADQAVLQDGLGTSRSAIDEMRRAHQDLIWQRIPEAKGS
ncbi:MAG: SAM-dependent methyltransferase [Deltaproteobacteria bacterium]|nr:SAM-dependent methyltransferase [Deltaproteobacteria bacterium]